MEKKSYPVITERVLEPLPPKRLFSRSRGRLRAEVPLVLAGQQLVYRTRNQLVLDTNDLPLDSPTVVDASHVSVVDVTADIEVVAELVIPSRDAANFTLRVAFLCTAVDPVAVVGAGGSDAASLLTGYLKGHQRIFQLGLDYDLADINDVRRKLDAQVRAYHTIEPPEFAGLAVTLASVEVMTPEQVAELKTRLREAEGTHVVRTTQLSHDHRLHDLEQFHRQSVEFQDTEHASSLDALRRAHARRELDHTTQVVGADPIAALYLAHAAGEVSTREVADELRRLHEREVEQDREDLRLAIQDERARDRLRWDAERADVQHRQETELEQSRAKREADRADALRLAEWEREDRHLARSEEMQQLVAQLNVIKALAAQGHLDTANLGPGLTKMINNVLSSRAREVETTAPSGDDLAITAPAEQPELTDDQDLAVDDDRSTKVEE
ncbi:hypothetical protein ADK67_07725 [Saccharothrix sp. NRRL B-16348]|uniref:hypothetical protein n=1 Tax=Saccharothrix sp. NRRL B-16348 TaxID=1415542 RepID=UPI0006B0527A|nr:hypothetical protein [Saccharothrix sp. NRRL B-16348]KOX32546.1 hypothetical protein ADK67_07725 [Saccharothrix sp. NRRL B-16348]